MTQSKQLNPANSSLPDSTESIGFSPGGLIFKLSVEDRLSCDVCSSRLAFEPDDVIGT